MHKTIPDSKISPVLLRSVYYDSTNKKPSGQTLTDRTAYDYELILFLQNGGVVQIGSNQYPLEKGSLAFIRPGQYTRGTTPYVCYSISFDMTGQGPDKEFNYNIYTPQITQETFRNQLIDGLPEFITPLDYSPYLALIQEIYNNAVNPSSTSQLSYKIAILQLIKNLYEDANQPHIHYSYSHNTIQQIVDYIHNNLDKRLDTVSLSKQCNLSPTYFHHVFKEHVKTTPNQYVIQLRLEKAKALLASTNLTIYGIACQCGFNNTSYFNYIFKKTLQTTPNEFRKRFTFH